MEDRYLFRGKCIDDGEWMSGSYYELAGRPLIFKPVFASKKAVYEIDPSTICGAKNVLGGGCAAASIIIPAEMRKGRKRIVSMRMIWSGGLVI